MPNFIINSSIASILTYRVLKYAVLVKAYDAYDLMLEGMPSILKDKGLDDAAIAKYPQQVVPPELSKPALWQTVWGLHHSEAKLLSALEDYHDKLCKFAEREDLPSLKELEMVDFNKISEMTKNFNIILMGVSFVGGLVATGVGTFALSLVKGE